MPKLSAKPSQAMLSDKNAYVPIVELLKLNAKAFNLDVTDS